MPASDDYYQILQVDPLAEPEVIEAAFARLARKYHPDVNPSPEATEIMKRINVAHEVLSDPERRKRYDSERPLTKGGGPLGRPKPVIDPPHIAFKDVTPGAVEKAAFLIFNTGGPYSKISISNPDSWLKIVDWRSIATTDELPLKVNLQAQVKDWHSTYSERVYVSLDNVQTILTVTLQTRFGLLIRDHKWHDVEFENLKDWVKKRKHRLNAGEMLKGNTFRYKFNRRTSRYQVRLRSSVQSAHYDPLVET
jgi:DnaJ domain